MLPPPARESGRFALMYEGRSTGVPQSFRATSWEKSHPPGLSRAVLTRCLAAVVAGNRKPLRLALLSFLILPGARLSLPDNKGQAIERLLAEPCGVFQSDGRPGIADNTEQLVLHYSSKLFLLCFRHRCFPSGRHNCRACAFIPDYFRDRHRCCHCA